MTFTSEQLADWRAYERVREGGRYNMFDPRARQMTRLSAKAYTFVMDNYSELQKAVEERKT